MKTSTGIRNAVASGILIAGLTACDKPEITTYRIAKEQPRATHSHAHEAPAPAPTARPRLTWTLPAGWREVPPGQINLAAFKIEAEGKEAQVTVAALPLMAGRESDIVNLWRGQLGLSPLDADQAREQLSELEFNGEKGRLFELAGNDPSKPDRIVTVMIHRPDKSWFYKLQGDAAPVAAQRTAFVEFIKSVRVEASESAPAAPKEFVPTANGFAKVAPESWKALPAGQMQLAKFSVPIIEGATGLVSVSVFDNDTGGTAANVVRWRRQIGLTNEISESQLESVAAPLDPKIRGSVLVNLTNGNLQLLGAIVPRGSQWFFYKLFGNAPAVGPEKEAFVRFATSEL